MDDLSVNKVRGQLDINDVYVFDAAGGRTVLAMTVDPAVNVLRQTTFNPDARYRINVDKTGDARRDLWYSVTFGDPDARGIQRYTVKRNGVPGGRIGLHRRCEGQVPEPAGRARLRGHAVAIPFFFDLIGFLGSVAQPELIGSA